MCVVNGSSKFAGSCKAEANPAHMHARDRDSTLLRISLVEITHVASTCRVTDMRGLLAATTVGR